MAPKPQEESNHPGFTGAPEYDGERVVISGMSGLYPDSHNIKEFSHILYNKINPITTERPRWHYNHPEVAHCTGKLPDLDRFDAQFFRVHYRLGNNMDCMSRKILEQAYQAIYDAGVNPGQLSGKNVGVYIGSCFSETEKACFYVASSRTGFGIAGCNKSMFANRISYWLNAKGPSLSIDAACCSSTQALELAYLAISRGDVEAAIVGGANVCLHPQSSVHYGRIMTTCKDGKTKSFDENANGCARSEAINVLFLQKAKNALRIYADVLHVKTMFTSFLDGETGPRYGFYRDPINMANFIREFYQEARVSPKAVEYVEAFGSAVPEADKAELEAIGEVYCKNRNGPLLVGSVMSNIGYAEAASGISSITKVLLAYHRGELAANMHFETPRQDVTALGDGRIRVVNEHQTFGRSYIAINSLSVTGINGHVLLHGHYKPKDPTRYKSTIPHLVTISGRQESAVKKVLDYLKSNPIDPEELALLHNFHETRISGHLGRGFIILDTNEEQKTISCAEKADYFDDAKRPLWFVYSGMGSQWAGMGAELMRIPIFAAAIERCRQALEPKGVDIVHIITSPDNTIFDNILNSFVGIAAIQIGLTDVLRELGIVPDKIIGHSVGELGCAYADGCFTAEEMILSAYSRGLVSVQTPFIRGSMAAVGVGYNKIIKMCPPEIEVACHNGPDSSTISGPADAMREFVAQLAAKNIFAKEVPCSNIAYHSRYIAEAGPGLLKYLGEVIKHPKPRSERWVSTSVPTEKWEEPAAKYSSAEYHTNNLLNPVLFEETSRLIPPNAVLIEIAPHGLLQAILKRSLPVSCRNIPLTRRGHTDNALFLLEAVGKLFMEGYNPKVKALYPKVEFPVSTGTPHLSHLVEWAHNEKWNLPLYVSAHRMTAAASHFVISVHDIEHSYLQGNVVKGKMVYPFAGALVAVWDTLAMSLGLPKKQSSVQFRDVQLYSQPILHDQRQLRLSVALQRGTGHFEILDNNSKVATGYITRYLNNINKEYQQAPEVTDINLDLNAQDIYQMFYERDYSYSGELRSIHSANTSLTEARLLWQDNWVTLIDGMLQLNTLRQAHDAVSQPARIRRICIDTDEHMKEKMMMLSDNTLMKVNVFDVQDYTRCGGVLLENITFNNLLPKTEDKLDLYTLTFVPRFQTTKTDVKTALFVYLQIVSENINKNVVKVIEILNHDNGDSVFKDIKEILDVIPEINVQFEQINRQQVLHVRDHFLTEADVVLVQNLSVDDNMCQILYRVLQRDTFIISAEENIDKVRPSALYRVVSTQSTGQNRLELVRWRPASTAAALTTVTVRTLSDLALLSSTRSNLPPRHNLVILSHYPPTPGLKELVKQWRKDADRNQIYLIMINFKSENEILDQMKDLDLAFEVLSEDAWGGEYYLPWQENLSVQHGLALRSARIGDLDSLYWAEALEPAGHGVPVTVHYTGLNSSDVKRATGLIPLKNGKQYSEISYGMDFSGITDSGERVMGLLSGDAARSRVLAHPEMLWPVPAHWSLEDAATVPLPYIHAFYCLGIKTKLFKHMSVLVHGGAGALGQAAINIALGNGCQVFTTVSDVRKKHFLRKLFPELKEEHIGNSRDGSFGDMVKIATKGKGVDIVICCVKGELKNTSILCNGSSGITLDTVQIQDQEDYAFGMTHLDLERSYVRVDLSSIFELQNHEEMKRLQLLLSEGIARGYVRPLSRVTYEPHAASRALRLLAASRHRGRALLRMREQVPTVQHRIAVSSEDCHLILCDKNHFGIQLADRLVSRGARKLHLHSPNTSTHLRLKIQSWQKIGTQVEVSSEDLNDKGIVALLNESNRLGPLEGVYVVASDVDNNTAQQLTSSVTSLDLISRKMCPSIKYFAVLSSGNIIGQQTCLSRAQDQLPATLIQLPTLKKMDDTKQSIDGAVCWRDALDAAERGLRSSQCVLLARIAPAASNSLLQQIAIVTKHDIPEDTDKSTTLQDLGIDYIQSQHIRVYLRDIYNLCLKEEDILELSLEKIREMEETITPSDFKEEQGLKAFFSYVDSDELLATTDMVFLPTLTRGASMRDDEFDVNVTFLCIVPGMEGHHERFRVLCERLKLPALVLQPGLDRLNETLPEMAQRYAKDLLKKTDLKSNFYLLGYESGVLVALEIAAILEEHDLVGTVFCVGSTPDELKEILNTQLDKKEDELQYAVIRHMFLLMGCNITAHLEKELLRASTWKEKVEVCMRTLRGCVPHSSQYAQAVIEAAYARILQTRRHTVTIRALRSKIVLLHAKQSTSTEVSSMQCFSQQPVAVYQLEAPLGSATRDLRCTAIINQYLDSEILQEYEKMNLCETYLLNADTFMANADDLINQKV